MGLFVVGLAVHPHGRGENQVITGSNVVLCGPSPRAWGKPSSWGYSLLGWRSIPTGVGKTPRSYCECRAWPVHPHGRGENPFPDRSASIPNGPSPRAWGKHSKGPPGFRSPRSIPTGVGKTCRSISRRMASSVHPHGRGENWSAPKNWLSSHGPSPRAWGKLQGRRARRDQTRSIPTGVGKTSTSTRHPMTIPVHPHGRGENSQFFEHWLTDVGPSPRAWGKRFWGWLRSVEPRSIPTGVGKTGQLFQKSVRDTVHPHGRGENRQIHHALPCHYGPSPRAWGKHLLGFFVGRIARSIPTGVGKTCGVESSAAVFAVHPHGRGENIPIKAQIIGAAGPSPRAWGKRHPRCEGGTLARSIPTGVGKTVVCED